MLLCVCFPVCVLLCLCCSCVCVPLSRCEGSVNTLPNSHTSPSSSSSSLFFPRTSHQFPSIYLLLLSVSGARNKYEGRILRQKIFFLPERYFTSYSVIGFNPILKKMQPWLKKYLIKLVATLKIILPTAVPKFPQRRSLFSPLSDHSVQLIQTFVSQLSITYHFLFIKLDKFASLGVKFIPDFFVIFGTPQRAAEKRFKPILAIWARPYKKQNIIFIWGLCWPLPTSKLQLQM